MSNLFFIFFPHELRNNSAGTPVYPYIYPKPKALCNGMEMETPCYHSDIHARYTASTAAPRYG